MVIFWSPRNIQDFYIMWLSTIPTLGNIFVYMYIKFIKYDYGNKKFNFWDQIHVLAKNANWTENNNDQIIYFR